jgi:hypothetical protein
MYNSILVPIDISEDSLTHMVIPSFRHIQHLTQLKFTFLPSFHRFRIIHH